MDLEFVKKFIQLAKDSGVCELGYEEKDKKIKVKLMGDTVHAYPQPTMAASVSHEAPKLNKPGKDAPASSSSKGLIEITSPFVGTFYKSASPDSAAYVKIGERVSPGKVLCIVEAMKIMNEIESEVSGEVVEICVENETYVEFGQVLFKLKP